MLHSKTRRLSAWGALGAVGLLLALTLPSSAQNAGGPPPPPPGQGGQNQPPAPGGKGAAGRISAVSAGSITVQSPQGDTATFTLSDTTKVLLDGQPATLDALTTGLFAGVASSDGTTAYCVDAHTQPPPPPPGQGPPPDGPTPPAQGQ
jgi:hypothetical protein